ncbi:MAG: hypothetical protein OXT01_30085, partial [Rhodospirillaceae bacterium]|nr:hypothetical protein [Rhodospirillaceae bacterium]
VVPFFLKPPCGVRLFFPPAPQPPGPPLLKSDQTPQKKCRVTAGDLFEDFSADGIGIGKTARLDASYRLLQTRRRVDHVSQTSLSWNQTARRRNGDSVFST